METPLQVHFKIEGASLAPRLKDDQLYAGYVNVGQKHIANEADYRRRTATVQNDRRYSIDGKQEQCKSIAKECRAKFEKTRDDCNYDKMIQQLREKLSYRPADTTDTVVRHLRQREIRDRLYGHDGISIEAQYGEGLRSGRLDDVLDAIEHAPSAFPLLPPDKLEELVSLRQKRLYPELYTELQKLEMVNRAIKSLNVEAEKVFREYLDKTDIEFV